MRESALAQGRNLEFVLIDQERDGIRKITDTLAKKSDLDAIHIISHATDGSVQLGSSKLDFETLLKRAAAVKKWGSALTENGDILFYGCDLAATEKGKSLMEAMSRLTGADVAASEDLTGAASKGGDWELEFRTGSIEAQVAVSVAAQSAWNHVLELPTYVGAAGALTSGTAAITPALPAGIQVGDLLLAVFETNNQAVTIANANGGVWTQVANSPQGGGGAGGDNSTRLTAFWSVYNGTQGAPTTNDPGDHIGGIIAAFRGVDTTNPINISSGATNTTTAMSIPGATTTSANSLVVVVTASNDDADAFSNWANASLTSMTERFELGHTAGQDGRIGLATGVKVTAGAYGASTSTLTAAVSARWAGMTIALAAGRAPTLDATKSPALGAINEDAGAPVGAVGTLVSSLVDFAAPAGQVDNVTDPDTGALLGIAITAADTTNGTWFYSTNDGTNWNALGAVANNNARLLDADANTRLYFQPNANFNGTVANAITFRAWDRMNGVANGGLADTTTNGGVTSFSSATDTASLTINAINDAPVNTVPGAQVAIRDLALVFSSGNGNLVSIADVDAGAASVQVQLTVTNGTLTLSGTAGLTLMAGANGSTTMTYQGTVANLNAAMAGMSYLPTTGYTGAATLTIVTNDLGNSGSGGALGDTDVVNISVQPAYAISGTIYNDVDGDADIVEGGTLTFAGAVVRLYRDDGDGVIDGGDTLVGSTTTDGSGAYSFSNNVAGTYWVTVDSKTLAAPAYNGGFGINHVWAEQTYGDDSSTAPLDPAARYGGRGASVSDDASVLTTAEHVSRAVIVGADVTGVNSGFSFSAVVNTRGDAHRRRRAAPPGSQQGSLRQFILNSNAIAGVQTCRLLDRGGRRPDDHGRRGAVRDQRRSSARRDDAVGFAGRAAHPAPRRRDGRDRPRRRRRRRRLDHPRLRDERLHDRRDRPHRRQQPDRRRTTSARTPPAARPPPPATATPASPSAPPRTATPSAARPRPIAT